MTANTDIRYDITHPASALAIVAHPDDTEFLAGGTLALWAQRGTRVTIAVVTNGDKGSEDDAVTSEQLASIRRQEQICAAEALGASKVLFLGYEDGMLEPSIGLRRDLTRLIRSERPDVVLSFDPTNRFIMPHYPNHPDHRACGDATMDAVFPAARDRLTFPELLEEGLQPHKVPELWLLAPGEPNHWVDVETTLEVKIAALREHRSQVSDEAIDQVLRELADESAGAPYRISEQFRRVVLD